jgi:hypothetical protein
MKNTIWIICVIFLILVFSCKSKKKSHTLPIVTTLPVAMIETNAALTGGSVESDNENAIAEVGVCWSTSPGATIASPHSSDGSSTGTFTHKITALTSGITYYVKAYAINNVGTAYGDEISFTTIQDSCSLRTYSNSIKKVFDDNCVACHSTSNSMAGIDLSTYSSSIATNTFALKDRITNGGMPMPTAGLMPQSEINKVICWIQNGRP